MNPIYPAWLAQIPVLLFVFAFGACVGSFINVLAYRLPRGEDVIVPASRCPSCGTRLTWRENLPIVGWLLLRGKCRFCKAPISPEYPLVETVVAGLFASLYALWFMQPSPFAFLGVDAMAARPEWTAAGLARMWPYFFTILGLVGALVAMTIIDAKTFTIPLVLPWVIGALGLVVHPVHAWWFARSGGSMYLSAHPWTIPTGGWQFTVAGVGGLVGLGVAAGLLRLGVLPQSFADYEEWEQAEEAKRGAKSDDEDSAEEPPSGAAGSLLARVLLFTGPAIAGMFLGAAIGTQFGRWVEGMAAGGGAGLLVGTFLRRLAPEDEPTDEDPVWTQYPHVRREMLKEAVFLALPIAGAAFGYAFAAGAAGSPPLWMVALGGSAAGVLIGGGVVWVVRVVFSLAFGKEAMGLGDVHMMAGIGAVLGWMDPVIAFFLAPFSGILFTIAAPLLGKVLRTPRVLPYGPHLALATLVIVYAKPLVENLLGLIARTPINLP